jgi:putative ABC transport system permease protein
MVSTSADPCLVLLIGVAGILNVGLATVGERVEEFALRRAVGTPRLLLAGILLAGIVFGGDASHGSVRRRRDRSRDIRRQGGRHVAGTFLSSREPFLQNLEFPWQAGVAGVIAGLLGGLIPAIRAARTPIAMVMRA